MKTFTYPTQKWVLTATLLAVLGLNVSFNMHKDGVASADFASTEGPGITPSKIYTAEGVVPVKYIDNGEDRVLALVPKKMTEGKVCDTCGYESYPLSVQNKEDIDSLNVALMKAISARLTTAKPQEEKKGEEVVADSDAEKKGILDQIAESCHSLKENRVYNCLSTKFVAALKSKDKSKNITTEEALDFYNEEIKPRLLSKAAEARRSYERSLRVSMGQDALNSLESSDGLMSSSQDIVDELSKSVRELIEQVPGKYESVRKALLSAHTDIIKFEAAQYKTALNRELTTTNTQEYPYLQYARMKQGENLESIFQTFHQNTTLGLQGAASKGFITTEQENQYYRLLNEFNTSLTQAIFNNGSALNGVVTTPTLDLNARLANPGRGLVPGAVVNPGISNRTGAPQVTVSPGIVPQTFSAQQMAPGTLPNFMPQNNSGVSFGPVSPISPQSLQQRLDIRGRF
ncbi:MAG: hypothetical protein OM95_04570 [Bdellovibrio sp. ArHS]|uniref:hypothetical protein n=1 Tax=Bdellovibrio sp. ArHS TaxID=1569284 RepID=UPI0005825FEF|nr:hypothetical protein [Bdellovibrio sp. ArHS]KHD89109.1 MAG: hypothetical protein OM95_04570 [Bdellovibrio sp. ArHS]